MPDDKRIELNIIDLTEKKEISKEDSYSFDSQLSKMRQERVRDKARFLTCPFCKDKFAVKEIASQIPAKVEKSFIECPHCASMIEVWINRD